MNAYEYIVRIKNYASNELRNIANSAGVAQRRITSFLGSLEKVDRKSNTLINSLGKLKTVLAAAFTFIALNGFISKVIEARQEYEKFDAVLTNTFQSKAIGQGALAMLTDFAAKTPYQLNELTGGFIKLVNRGVYPTYEEMTKLGDLASSQGKSFDQLVEAILDAQTGEFERMKEFGIKASKSGDTVKLTFKGVTKEVANNEKAIKDAILAYGGMKGVAGSMAVISETLGGKISNLEDQWWSFLVAVGGYSGGIFGDVLSLAADSIAFLQDHLPEIAHWFNLIMAEIRPMAQAIWDFVKAAFNIKGSGDILQTFGDIMSGVILVVQWMREGLVWLLDALRPIAPVLKWIAIAWAVMNAIMAVTPIGWIIIGIVALITIIGMLIKYTDGWGESWKALKVIFTAIWDQMKADFNFAVQTFKNGFNLIILYAEDAAQRIIGRFSKVGEAIQMAISGDFSGAFNKAFEKVETKASGKIKDLLKNQQQQTADYISGRGKRATDIQNASKKFGITVDTDGIKKDFEKVKSSFKGLKGEQTGNPKDYLNAIPGLSGASKGKDPGDGDDKKKKKKSGDSITGGGSRLTNITININKLQDQTVIHVSKTEEGLNGLGDKVQEILLRAVNSANQMQTT
ncbi:hypothetical protein CMT52_07855 [Elizabethkingia anophelis]|nr:hypothetical protein [Elizabethkingia anophelis]